MVQVMASSVNTNLEITDILTFYIHKIIKRSKSGFMGKLMIFFWLQETKIHLEKLLRKIFQILKIILKIGYLATRIKKIAQGTLLVSPQIMKLEVNSYPTVPKNIL